MKMKVKKFLKSLVIISTSFIVSNSIYAADDEVEISDLNSSFNASAETAKKIQNNLSKFRGQGCQMVPTKDCSDRIICSYIGSAHVNSKGVVAPRSFERGLANTYRSAKVAMTKYIEEVVESKEKCIDKIGNETINGDISKERITSFCETTVNTSAKETLKGVINVGYAFNSKNGQIAAAVGMSCSSNQAAGRIKANNLKTSNGNNSTDSPIQSQEPPGVPIQQGVESSEYFNEDF